MEKIFVIISLSLIIKALTKFVAIYLFIVLVSGAEF